jgi:hypothetical protein
MLALLALAHAEEPPGPVETTPATEPAPPLGNAGARPGSKTPLPEGPEEGAFLGLVAKADGGASWWTPKVDAAVVVLAGAEAWAAYPPGEGVPALGPDGPLTLTFRGVSEIPYGCDGGATVAALFDGPSAPEGLVWIRVGAETGKVVLPTPDAKAKPTRRGWSLGNVHVVTSGKKQRGRTVVERDGKPVFTLDWEKATEHGPVNLDEPTFEPIPAALFRAGDGARLLLAWQSLEGLHWTTVRLKGDQATEGHDFAQYWCAY